MQEFNTEIRNLHTAKLAVCYLLEEIGSEISEKELYEIVMQSEAVNYFHYNQALEELIGSGALTEYEENGISFFRLEEKGRQSAEAYNDYVPYHFRKRLLKSAFSFFTERKHEREAKIELIPRGSGFDVNCKIGGAELILMDFSVYAPDRNQAELIKGKILDNPEFFYKNVISFLLDNEKEKFEPKK